MRSGNTRNIFVHVS